VSVLTYRYVGIELTLIALVPALILTSHLLSLTGTPYHYVILAIYLIALINIHYILYVRGMKRLLLWPLPLAILVQDYFMGLVGIELSSFLALTIILLTSAYIVPLTSSSGLRNVKWGYIIPVSILVVAVALYLDIPYIPYIAMGPVCEYLFVTYIGSGELVNSLIASLSIASLYHHVPLLTMYVIALSLIKAFSGRYVSHAITIDTVCRAALLWVITYAA